MKSLNFVVLGDASIASELGKKGSVTDITMYDKKSSGKIFTFCVPSSFPEKIQPLMQSIALSEYAILNVKSIDKDLGEQIVALDTMKMDKGFIVPNGYDDDLKNFIKGTCLENYIFVSSDDLKQKIEDLEPVKQEGKTKMIIDAAFEVKGIGTVILGVVRRGTLKKHDELQVFPGSDMLSVRSIQMHDDDVDSTESPGRLGIASKGVTSDDVRRGDVVAEKDSIESSKELKVNFEKSKFYKDEINPTSGYHLCVGLQINPVKVSTSSDGLSVVSERPFAFEKGENCVLLDLNSNSVRIVGSGTIL